MATAVPYLLPHAARESRVPAAHETDGIVGHGAYRMSPLPRFKGAPHYLEVAI